EAQGVSRLMKIGLVSPYDWSYPGGVRDHVWNLANEFIALGHDVRILAPASGPKRKIAEKYIYKIGWTTPIPANGSIARVVVFDPALNLRVRKVLQREQFDILHIHEPLVPGLSLSALRCSQTITIGTFHASSEVSLTSTFNLAYTSTVPFLRPFWRRLHGRIVVSNATYKFISHHFPADYRIIPNGIHLERFTQNAAPFPALRDGKQNILFLSRFEKRKGAKYLLRAIPTIREQHPNTRFIFVGEGRLRAGFQRFVERKNWQDVVFTGYIPEEDKARYLASADIFCAPAIGGESLGIVLLEAMAAGKPIVASNISGYRTVITDGVEGLLTPPRHSSELASAISQLLEEETLRQRLGKAGQQKAREYAWPHVAAQVLNYYHEVIAEQKNPAGNKIYG
ncbi:MAG TPA: glycosyltransferase family 4 protein, partial [Ktedonobacteraceae bacterium]|nr:glycosyltransferase family 4 protein [Ktedonobacteraceae bacterium]